jgi:hypothetical protein
VFLALVSVECVWTHIYVGGVVLQAYSSYAFTHSLLSISGFLCSHSLLLFLSLSFLSYVFVIHSSWGLHTEQSNKGEASNNITSFGYVYKTDDNSVLKTNGATAVHDYHLQFFTN